MSLSGMLVLLFWLPVVSLSLSNQDWITRAQCQAACLQKFGSVRTDPFDHIYDMYRVHRCSSDQCKQCTNPCDWIISNPAICQSQCMTPGCRESCSLIYGLHEQSLSDHGVLMSKENLTLDNPTVVCKETPSRVPFDGPDIAKLFLRWNTRDLLGISTLKPIVYVIAIKGQQKGQPQEHWTVLGKTGYAFLPIQNLTAGGTYKFQITAVTADGVVDEPKETDWTTTLAEGAVGDPPTNIHLVEQTLNGDSMEAIVQWTPGRDPACYFIMYWMTPGESSYGEQKIRQPLPEAKLKLKDLSFGMNYTIQSYSYDREFRRSSTGGLGWIVTSKCLDATNNNFTICAPGPVQKVTHRVIGWHGANQSADVLLEWKAPVHTSSTNNISSYIVEWRKVPPMNTQLPVEPHQNETIVMGNQTFLVVQGLHLNNVYSFWVTARTLGGDGAVNKVVLAIGSGNSYRNAAVKQYDQVSIEEVHPFSSTYIILIVVVLVLVCIILSVVVMVTRWRRKRSLNLADRSTACLKEFNPLYSFSNFGDPELALEEVVLFKDEYEVKWSDLDLLETVGEGAFGRVIKAKVKSYNLQISADYLAVKTLREHLVSETEKRDLLLEIELMKELGQHRNVVSILGCCTVGPNICLLMDYCPLGDLRNYLKKHRTKVSYCDMTGYSQRNNPSASDSALGQSASTLGSFSESSRSRSSRGSTSSQDSGCSYYYNNPCLNTSMDELTDPPTCNEISETQLISYARQIAVGMEYLSQKKFVHRDLAARNILMYDEKCVKISDFGLTRDVYETSVYKPSAGKKVPFKWMPLEAIFDQTFTTKSDVWSFGIVLWEIMTMGATPYPGMESKELLNSLKNGFRMEKPDNCKDEIYQLMLKCWHPTAEDRPSFTEIRNIVDRMLEATQSYMDLVGECFEDDLGIVTQSCENDPPMMSTFLGQRTPKENLERSEETSKYLLKQISQDSDLVFYSSSELDSSTVLILGDETAGEDTINSSDSENHSEVRYVKPCVSTLTSNNVVVVKALSAQGHTMDSCISHV